MRQGWCPKCQKLTVQNVLKIGFPVVQSIAVECTECHRLIEWKNLERE